MLAARLRSSERIANTTCRIRSGVVPFIFFDKLIRYQHEGFYSIDRMINAAVNQSLAKRGHISDFLSQYLM